MRYNLPNRRPARLRGYDYSTPGAYFITICTHERKNILSSICVGAIHESPASKTIINEYSSYGKIVEDYIKLLPSRFDISIPKFVIMPNHIHMIIEIQHRNDDNERAIRESPLQKHRSTIDKTVGFLKMNTSRKIHTTFNDRIWQRSYHDHIIRNGKEYAKIWEYIDTNVLRWKDDCFYSTNS